MIVPQSIQRLRVPSVEFHCRSHSAGVVAVGVVSNCTQFTQMVLVVVGSMSVTDCRSISTAQISQFTESTAQPHDVGFILRNILEKH